MDGRVVIVDLEGELGQPLDGPLFKRHVENLYSGRSQEELVAEAVDHYCRPRGGGDRSTRIHGSVGPFQVWWIYMAVRG